MRMGVDKAWNSEPVLCVNRSLRLPRSGDFSDCCNLISLDCDISFPHAAVRMKNMRIGNQYFHIVHLCSGKSEIGLLLVRQMVNGYARSLELEFGNLRIDFVRHQVDLVFKFCMMIENMKR